MKKIKTLNRIYSVILVMLFLFLCGCKRLGNGNENSSLDTTSYTLSFTERPFNNDEIDFGKVGTVSTGKIKDESNTQEVTVGEGRKVGDVIYKSINYNEIKAVWISYIDLENMLKGRSEKDYTNNIKAAFKTCADLGINTVIFQVRPFGDALYESKLFPWSSYASGSLSTSPGFDPLKIAVEAAHNNDLSLHAWVNPYRCVDESSVGKIANDFLIKKWYNDSSKKGNWIVTVDGRLFLNPAIPEVRQLLVDGIDEIVRNYKVDGVQLDDYFYPTTQASFDEASFKTYGNGLSLADFRRNNVSVLIADIYSKIKSIDKSVLFGISPQANISNDINSQYIDINTICRKSGYIDYICPQIYYNYQSETTDFLSSLKEWNGIVLNTGTKLCIGIAAYKVGQTDTWACTAATSKKECSNKSECGANGWINSGTDIMKRQYNDSKKANNYLGVFFFRYESLISLSNEEKQNLKDAMNT